MFGNQLDSARRFTRRGTALEREFGQAPKTGRGRRRTKLGAGLVTIALAGSALVTGSGLMVNAAPVGAGFELDAGDLRFILKQIQIAEAHSAGGELLGPGPDQVNERRLPFGLRTVDGTLNHLTPGQTEFGAADEVFPRMTTSVYRDGEPIDLDGPGPSPAIPSTSYNQTKGIVADSAPRLISNLIVDQTANNPAAVAVSGGCVELDGPTCFIGNSAPDVGLSAPFNSMFTFFGQFFDHGLDLVTKGGGTVFVPLAADDPLRTHGPDGIAGNGDEVPPHLAFLTLTRATNQPGPDGVTGDNPATFINEALDDTPAVPAGPGADGILGDNPLTNDPAGNEAADNVPVDPGADLLFGVDCNTAAATAECADDTYDAGPDLILVDNPLTTNPDESADDTPAVPVGPGPDGVLGDDPATFIDESADDVKEATNTTTPFVDQNQTYTSHPSHQVFLREYSIATGEPVSTGRLIDGAGGNVGNWAEVKQQAATMLGIELVDSDIFNVPLLVTDPYGYFIRGLNGFPLLAFPPLVPGGPNQVVEGNPLAPISTLGSMKTGHAFLDDIAHNASPKTSRGVPLTADADPDVNPINAPRPAGTYDDELLDAHFITGDGRGNENIGLTAVHTIFHAEHNRLQRDIDELINLSGFLTLPEVAAWNAVGPSGWDYGERLFQAARFVTEMQYQHLVFEEFARKLVPTINPFIGDGINFQSDTNPAITAEFAHAVYRLGHSMLTENILRTNEDGSTNDISLFEGFLNPLEFNDDGAGGTLTAAQAAGAIFQGGVREQGNHIDEFITNVLRNQLLGLPLDLAVFNLARGRSEGLPPLNSVRRQLLDSTGEPALTPYESWIDFSFNMKYQDSLVNFIAAYGTHTSITTFDLDGPGGVEFPGSIASRRAAADQIINGTVYPVPTGVADDPGTVEDESVTMVNPPADSSDFLFSQGTWTSMPDGTTTTGVDGIDLWIGGLAERTAPFGGMLGTTFTYVFEIQMENLQNADRFYYLERLDGLNLLPQLEANSFAELIMRNTSAVGFPADVFSRPDFAIEVANLGASGPIVDDPNTVPDESDFLIRLPNGTIRFNGPEHVNWNGVDQAVLGGPPVNDRIISSEGDDTLRGNGGNDILEGGSGNDSPIGGMGDDIITDIFGDDVLKGGPGNDAIFGGPGLDLLQGNADDDYIIAGNDTSEVFGGPGDDVIYVGDGGLESFAGAGDDWIEGSPQLDLLVGDENNQFQDDPRGGHDVIIGNKGDDDYDSEGGDDVMVGDVLGTERFEGMLGWDAATYRGDPLPVDADMNINVVLAPNLNELRDRFDLTEGLSGWNFNDVLRGTDRVATQLVGHELNAAGIARLDGIAALLPVGETSFDGGDIIMGGAGTDVIEGRGGDDILDGDRWLNAQLRAPNHATPAPGDFRLVDNLKAIQTDVRTGRTNPASIDIVRSIVTPTVPAEDCGSIAPGGPVNCDTAVFSGLLANYAITPNGDGSVTIADNVGTDGVDTLWNIEQAVFCDDDPATDLDRAICDLPSASVSLTDFPSVGLSVPSLTFAARAIGAVAVTQQITVTNTGDADLIVSGFSITGVDAASFGATEDCATLTPGATCTFTVSFDPAVAGALVADLNIFSNAGTVVVPLSGTGVVNTPVAGAPTISDTTPTEGTAITASTVGIADVDGVPLALSFQWRQSLTPGGAVNTIIAGATGPSFTPTQLQANRRLTVAVSFVDNAGSLETAVSAITIVVGDLFNGGAGVDVQTGTAGQDEYHGGGGADNLATAGQDDIVSGDADDDTISTAGGNDIITFNGASEGFDAVTGGAGVDAILAASNGTVIGLRSISTVESISNNGFAGVTILGSPNNDVLNFTNVTLTGIVLIDGGGSNDALTGSAGNDVIVGRAGTDTINGGIGIDTIEGGANNDTLNGGNGNDFFRYNLGGFGNDTITGFDADVAGGQDLINLTGLGINAGNFAANVTITNGGGGATLVTIPGHGTIRLAGVAVANVTIADFIV